MREDLRKQLYTLLVERHGISPFLVDFIELTIMLLLLCIACLAGWWVSRRIILAAVSSWVQKTKVSWDDVLLEKKVFSTLAHIAPAIMVYALADSIFYDFPRLAPAIKILTNAIIALVIIIFIKRLLDSLNDILSANLRLKDKPINSYIQLAQIFVYFVGGVFIISILLNKSPLYFFSAMGAMTAVLMLVFKDTILGFIASIQLSANDMVRIGDWVSMPKFGADGDVIEINLATIKVQNFDKTVTTIPTYSFISDSFKNWRGMQESSGRRIKRAISIKASTIRFATNEELKKYESIDLLTDYIKEKREEIRQHNMKHQKNKELEMNGRNLTNVGVFRIYVENYLKSNPKINQEMTCMARQLEITETGLPIEIYAFSVDKVTVNYERIMADIFDHILAVIPEFGLEVFQSPTGSDMRNLVRN